MNKTTLYTSVFFSGSHALSRGLHIPTNKDLKTYIVYCLVIDVVFITVYGGTNWFTAQREHVLNLYWDWELSIPFIAEFIWIYISMFVLFFIPVFQLRGPELSRLGKQILIGIVISGLVFLLLPAKLGFQRVGNIGKFSEIFSFIYLLDYPHNQLPSLHIVFSGLIIASFMEVANHTLRLFYGVWMVALLMSVLLVHQHHILDLAGAFAVIWICRTLVINKYVSERKIK